jgi:hypothetical protein
MESESSMDTDRAFANRALDKPDTIGADELFWRGVLDPRDRALDQALVGQPR